MNVNEIRQKIDDLDRQYKEICSKLYDGATIKKIKELNGEVELLTEDIPDFDNLSDELDSVSNEYVYYKTLLLEANNKIMINDTDTIQAGIVKVQQLRKLHYQLSSLLNLKPGKIRKSDSNNNSAYYQITELNFNKNVVAEKCESLLKDINLLELQISKANELDYKA